VPASRPTCSSKALRRSKRRGVFELTILRVIPVRPFRCRDCDRRFYSLSSSARSIQSTSAIAR
jgi:hypothetical protein